MYQVLIIEDDECAAAHLGRLVSNHPEAAHFDVSCVDSASLECRLAMGAAPHIAFVDINLGDGVQSGIQLVERCFPDGSPTQVIYVTGYIEYCTEVYQTDHVSFLLKPLEQEPLDRALDKALRNLDRARRESLAVRAGGATRMVPAQAIEFIESHKRKLAIHTDEGELQTYATLSDAEDRLPIYFLRCHKSYLVNMNHITELRADEITMRSGAVIPVSRTWRAKVKERFARFLAGALR